MLSALDLIALKPTIIYTDRNPSTPITVRIETWVTRQKTNQKNDNQVQIADVLVFAYVGADLQFQDRFVANNRRYEILHKLPQTEQGDKDQFTAIIRD